MHDKHVLDNAMQESFGSTLKSEFCYWRRWATRQEAILATGRWMEEFYNRAQLHSALGRTTPAISRPDRIGAGRGQRHRIVSAPTA